MGLTGGEAEHLALLGPGEGQSPKPREEPRSNLPRLTTIEDGLDDVRGEISEAGDTLEMPELGPGHGADLILRHGQQLIPRRKPARDKLDQIGIVGGSACGGIKLEPRFMTPGGLGRCKGQGDGAVLIEIDTHPCRKRSKIKLCGYRIPRYGHLELSLLQQLAQLSNGHPL